MERRLKAKRKSSSLPSLINLVLARPVVSAGLIATELKIPSAPRSAWSPSSTSGR
ncbi:helix-turn-helix domain-containing protein [Mesorhizobium sp. WSM2561]|uniref:helix-turn-helix domain-containing protein n=1 Tax=Mesorhizobium sp. WSM2561 TaxID=1040985 RepID=UPI0004BC21DD